MNPAENILIVLGYPADGNGDPGAILKSRLDKAIELYRHGNAGKIIVTGAAVDNEFVESEVMAVYLVRNGIPHTDIFVESSARNTYENALMVSRIMREKGYKKAMVVTSSFHRMRAKKFFRRHVDNVTIVPAPFPKGFPLAKRLLYELKEYIIIFLFNLGLLNSWYSVQRS
ncbi:MAG TPA: YdcF family protein [Flavipsychrobacter sp.]